MVKEEKGGRDILKKLLVLLLLLCVIQPVNAAVIYGKLYRWDTLDILKNVVVTIKDHSIQRMISKNGSYSFDVPPGNYTIIAEHGDLYAVENVTVVNGKNRFDIILFPRLNISEPPAMPSIPTTTQTTKKSGFPYYILAIIICAAVVGGLYYKKAREKGEEEEELPPDLSEVLEVIRSEGGRITQKELRKRLGYSEAKMSLVIADLERRGLVEKVKKGRGNIIFLKKP